MSNRNSIIVLGLIVILIIGGLFWYFNTGTSTPNTTPITQTDNTALPFGNTPQNKPSNTGGTGATSTTVGTSTQVIPAKITAKLFQVYKNPTSGSVFFVNKSGQEALRFVDRGNGNVYEYVPASNSGESVRITNTTVPKIQEALWSAAGSAVLFRYLDGDTDHIATFDAKIVATSTGSLGMITGTFLASDILQAAANPKGDKLFSFFEKKGGAGSYGVLSNFDGSGKKQVFDSPVALWNVSWPKENILAFTTKPTYKDDGFLFFFNPTTSSFDKILGGLPGLSALANQATDRIAYSMTNNGSFYLDIYDVKNKATKDIRISTLADKCAWDPTDSTVLYCAIPQTIPNANYPDSWYDGTVSFSDSLWRINTDADEAERVYQTSESDGRIDAMNLAISPSGQYVSFINKNDLSFWLLSL